MVVPEESFSVSLKKIGDDLGLPKWRHQGAGIGSRLVILIVQISNLFHQLCTICHRASITIGHNQFPQARKACHLRPEDYDQLSLHLFQILGPV